MTFPPIDTPVPTAIKAMYLPLFRKYITNPEGIEEMVQGANFKFLILWDDGHYSDIDGDLVPYLSADDITWLIAFADRMWAKAELELIP